jgi:hypothetical protein
MWYSETLGVIKTPRPISKDGINHPRNIFRLWSKEELAALDIRPARIVTPDSRYFNTGAESYDLVDGEWVISYAETEKKVDPIKEQLISKVKQHVASILAPSDWRIIREQEGYKVAGDAWKTWRGEVRDHGNELEETIQALTDIDSVKTFQNHPVTEVRYVSTYVDDEEVIGPETESYNREVDKSTWGWPVAPDAEADPYHVRYE